MEYIGKYQGFKVYEVKDVNEARHYDDTIYAAPNAFGFDLFLWGKPVGWCDVAYNVREFNYSDVIDEVEEYRNPKPEPQPLVVEVLESPETKETDDFWNKIENEIKNTLENGAKSIFN
jgi:hypothetical protein